MKKLQKIAKSKMKQFMQSETGSEAVWWLIGISFVLIISTAMFFFGSEIITWLKSAGNVVSNLKTG